MKNFLVIALIAVETSFASSQIQLSVVVDRDSFLPYEPIFARVVVSNIGRAPVRIPIIGRHVLQQFDFSVSDAKGNNLIGYSPMSITYAKAPFRETTLESGCSLSSDYADFNWKVGRPDPEGFGMYCLLPGDYRLSGSLSGVAWWCDTCIRTSDSSAPVYFTVRSPDSAEEATLKLYRELLFFERESYWGQFGYPDPGTATGRGLDRDRRISESAWRLIRNCPAEPYTMLAEGALLEVLGGRLYESRGLNAPLEDSVIAVAETMMEGYPNSRTAQQRLRIMMGAARGSQRIEPWIELLRRLSARVPNTLVGAEACKQLLLLGKR